MKKYLLILLVSFVTVPLVVFAGGIKDTKNLGIVADSAGVKENSDLATVVGTIINVALSVVGLVFLILMVYGGYLWLTSRGDETQIDKSKDIIRSSIIGLVIVLSAYAITVLVTSRFK